MDIPDFDMILFIAVSDIQNSIHIRMFAKKKQHMFLIRNVFLPFVLENDYYNIKQYNNIKGALNIRMLFLTMS